MSWITLAISVRFSDLCSYRSAIFSFGDFDLHGPAEGRVFYIMRHEINIFGTIQWSDDVWSKRNYKEKRLDNILVFSIYYYISIC